MLVEPVALAVQPGELLYVADRGRNAVVVFDLFGSYARLLAPDTATDVQALLVSGDDLWIVCTHRLLIYDSGRRLSGVVDVQLDQPLVDAGIVSGHLYLLTPTVLYRTDLPSF